MLRHMVVFLCLIQQMFTEPALCPLQKHSSTGIVEGAASEEFRDRGLAPDLSLCGITADI